MAKSSSSKQWLREHFRDPLFHQAQADGYRSRAAYKLLEIDKKDRLIKPGNCVIDLGAAPGGWSQVVARQLQGRGKIIAIDRLEFDPIVGVEFIQADLSDATTIDQLLSRFAETPIDLVLSDMAPNLSGSKSIDQPRVMYLCEMALEIARGVLKPNGDFLVKIFHGAEFESYYRSLRTYFQRAVVRKPSASRSRSAECYLLARGFKK